MMASTSLRSWDKLGLFIFMESKSILFESLRTHSSEIRHEQWISLCQEICFTRIGWIRKYISRRSDGINKKNGEIKV